MEKRIDIVSLTTDNMLAEKSEKKISEAGNRAIISRLEFIKLDLEAISKVRMSGEMANLVKEIHDRLDILKKNALDNIQIK